MTPADLRAARHALGLSQHQFAAALRMGKHGWRTVSMWETDGNVRGVPGPVQVAVELMLAGGYIAPPSAGTAGDKEGER